MEKVRQAMKKIEELRAEAQEMVEWCAAQRRSQFDEAYWKGREAGLREALGLMILVAGSIDDRE